MDGDLAVPEDSATNSSARPFSLRQRLALSLISTVAPWLIRLVGSTLRFKVICEPGCLTDGFTGPPSIWCFWHRCVIPVAYFFRGKQIAILISLSFDGEYIARIARKLGARPVRGSSSRGAVGGMKGMRRELEEGHVVAFTVDGPRGPRYVAKSGPIMVAQAAGHPVNCVYLAVERAWVLNSWDRMIIPKPFSRVCVYMSSPLDVPANPTPEQLQALRSEMQSMLDRCRAEAEKYLGIHEE
jgi:lysophospholipid acyltransferase (LPLAT)-like uncharacterized protein